MAPPYQHVFPRDAVVAKELGGDIRSNVTLVEVDVIPLLQLFKQKQIDSPHIARDMAAIFS